ncbi:MAG: ribonuclease III [Kiritimatiellaeota bacterium]|nr:ribonuclease III [Kiritimatiellota bacterium]
MAPEREAQGAQPADTLAALEATLGYAFNDRSLLETALTAPSYRAAQGVVPCADNQRLEFLGDAVLGLLAAEHLFNTHQDIDEGGLTIRRSHLTSGAALAQRARRVGLGTYLRIGLSDEKTGGVNKSRLLAEVMEAVFGAVWCDGGLPAVRPIFEAMLRPEEEVPETDLQEENPKGHLQEIAQRHAWAGLPAYELVSTSGPDHAPSYVVRLRVEGDRETLGEGSTKRGATVLAARRMLEVLKGEGIE